MALTHWKRDAIAAFTEAAFGTPRLTPAQRRRLASWVAMVARRAGVAGAGLRLLLLGFDFGPLVAGAHMRRFGALPAGARAAWLRRWHDAPVYAVRAAFAGLRAVIGLAYGSLEEVRSRAGRTP
jgi:hypothetical protein